MRDKIFVQGRKNGKSLMAYHEYKKLKEFERELCKMCRDKELEKRGD